MADNSKENKVIAPYIPFLTFTGFIDKLHNTTVPPIIDGSLLQTMSGSMRSQLVSTLKFMNLTDNQGIVQQKLREVVTSYKTDTWQETLSDLILDAYTEVIGNVDLDSGTAQQLNEAFRNSGNVEGQMQDKAVRFFLAALKEAGIMFSPHFLAKKTRKTVVKKKKSKKNPPPKPEDFLDELPEIDNTSLARFHIPIPDKKGATIFLPNDLDHNDWDMVKTMLDAYVTRLTNKARKH